MARELEEQNLGVVAALYEATGKGDWESAEAMLTEDFSITEADTLPFAGVYRGRRALHDLYLEVMSTTGVTGLDIQQMTAGGDHVVTLLELVIGGPPEVRVPMAEAFRLRDGKVCAIKPYYYDPRPVVAAVEANKRRAAKS